MSWPSKDALDTLLKNAKTATQLVVSSETLIYLIENLRRVNQEIAAQADLLDDLRDRYDELHEDYNKQLRRAKRWKKRYAALANQQEQSS